MNRNVESHFRTTPTVKHQRSTFDRSYSHSTSFNFGKCIPLAVEEVLPGDTVSIKTSKIIRMQTLLAPVLSNMYFDTYWFFVPNRIIWSKWKEFMGENTNSAWIPTTTPDMPTLIPPTSGWQKGTIADYMGIPVGAQIGSSSKAKIQRLPFMAYAMIWNDFFRDQNLDDPLVVSHNNQMTAVGSNGSGLQDVELGGMPCKANKFHDMFTSCLPAPQKGPTVLTPITGKAPVIAGAVHGSALTLTNPAYPVQLAVRVGESSGAGSTNIQYSYGDGNVIRTPYFDTDSMGNVYNSGASTAVPSNLWTVYGSSYTDAHVGIDVNALRLSVATQQYYEALARSGSRLEEQIATFFGVTNPDSRVQHPEYLGGNRVQINVHEVTNTAQSEADFLGDLGAQSVTADSHNDFTKSFTEHGWLMCIGVARYDHIYSQGIERKFTRKDKFDFYNPMFANIGEQPIYNYEIWNQTITAHPDADKVFGYNEAWVHYRTAQNRVSGELRPTGTGNLTHWTAADNYISKPTLSSEWLKEDAVNVDRCLAVSSSLANQLFGDFYFNAKWTRCMPMYSVPGQLGSF